MKSGTRVERNNVAVYHNPHDTRSGSIITMPMVDTYCYVHKDKAPARVKMFSCEAEITSDGTTDTLSVRPSEDCGIVKLSNDDGTVSVQFSHWSLIALKECLEELFDEEARDLGLDQELAEVS